MGILDWPLKDSRQPYFGKGIRRDFSLGILLDSNRRFKFDKRSQLVIRTHNETLPVVALAAGKRRPCCYSIVSLDLHLAVKGTPTAKAQWSDLTSAGKRRPDVFQSLALSS